MTEPGPRRPIDREATERLAEAMMKRIKQHYTERPTSPDTVYEVLNALAVGAAFVIAGTKPDIPRTRRWFVDAVKAQLDLIKEHRL